MEKLRGRIKKAPKPSREPTVLEAAVLLPVLIPAAIVASGVARYKRYKREQSNWDEFVRAEEERFSRLMALIENYRIREMLELVAKNCAYEGNRLGEVKEETSLDSLREFGADEKFRERWGENQDWRNQTYHTDWARYTIALGRGCLKS